MPMCFSRGAALAILSSVCMHDTLCRAIARAVMNPAALYVHVYNDRHFRYKLGSNREEWLIWFMCQHKLEIEETIDFEDFSRACHVILFTPNNSDASDTVPSIVQYRLDCLTDFVSKGVTYKTRKLCIRSWNMMGRAHLLEDVNADDKLYEIFQDCDILILTETHLKGGRFLKLPNCIAQCFKLCGEFQRGEELRGGGILIFVKRRSLIFCSSWNAKGRYFV